MSDRHACFEATDVPRLGDRLPGPGQRHNTLAADLVTGPQQLQENELTLNALHVVALCEAAALTIRLRRILSGQGRPFPTEARPIPSKTQPWTADAVPSQRSLTTMIDRRTFLAAATIAAASPSFAADRPTPLRIGNQKGGLRSLLEASGVARDTPYALEWAEFSAAAPLLEALNAGALDVGYQGDLAFLTSFAAGAPLRIIGAGRPSAAAQAILVRGDSAIRTVADLKGRRVAGNRGGWGQYLIRAALKQAGVGHSDVDVILLPPTDAALAFRSGAVDAWAVWDPYVSLEVQQFGARVLVDGRGLTPAIMLVSAHEDAIRTKRAQLADFLTRFRAGWAWADQHIADYARYNAALTGLPEPVLRRTYETERTQPAALTPALIAELQAAAENALEFGLLRQKLDVRRAFDTSLDPVGAA